MASNVLADTGALLALLNRKDPWHARCVEPAHSLRFPLLTSEAVLTELYYMIGSGRHEMEGAWRFVRPGSVSVLPIDDSDLPEIQSLMLQYADRPMDLADATLVHLAKRESLTTVFTVDHEDFETYRIGGRRRFRVLPARTVN